MHDGLGGHRRKNYIKPQNVNLNNKDLNFNYTLERKFTQVEMVCNIWKCGRQDHHA